MEHAQDWAFSSYQEYIGLRHGTLPVPGAVLDQFPSRQAYREFVEAYRPQDERTVEHLLFDE